MCMAPFKTGDSLRFYGSFYKQCQVVDLLACQSGK